MKQVEVRIMGQGYLLGCAEGGENRLRDAVSRVDAAMCKIRDAGKIKARDRIAVLAALNLAFELGKPADNSNAAADTPHAAGSNANTTTAPQNAPAPSGTAAASATTANAQNQQAALSELLTRLDDALSDGQLL